MSGFAGVVDAIRALALSAEAADAEADAMREGRLDGDYAAINDAVDRADAAREALVGEVAAAERAGVMAGLADMAAYPWRRVWP